jgi:phosphoglycerate dehydrogenase-like enzyme
VCSLLATRASLHFGDWSSDFTLNRMSWRVLVTASGLGRAGERAQVLLRQAGCELLFPAKFGPLRASELQPLLAGCDAVIASLDEYSSTVLEAAAAEGLKLIARWGVGYDSVDVAAATRRGIVVTYTPGLLDEAVAEYTFALLLALARRVVEGHSAMQQNQWKVSWGNDIAGKTLGIIGLGRIGLAVARRAAAFDLRVLACGPRPKPEADRLGVRMVSLDELLGASDFVSLHAALTPETRGLIGHPQLGRMKKSAYLINTARGALIDEPAVAAALREKQIAGAALDVFTVEPLPAGSPLRSAPNLLLSPHQASFSYETGERVSLATAEAVIDRMQGRMPRNVLNPEVLSANRSSRGGG